MHEWKCERCRVAKPPPKADTRHGALDGEDEHQRKARGHESYAPCRRCRKQHARCQQAQRHRRYEWVRHHSCRRHGVAGKAFGMTRNDIQATVSKAILLREIAGPPFAPSVAAARRTAKCQTIA